MKCVLPLLAAVTLLMATGARALKCYACVPNHKIAGVTIPREIADKTSGFPRCSEMKPKDPELRFEMNCPPNLDRSCIKIRDDRGNELRSCFSSAVSKCTKTSKKGQVMCTCRGDFCNGSGRLELGWALTLLAPLAAALLRLHH